MFITQSIKMLKNVFGVVVIVSSISLGPGTGLAKLVEELPDAELQEIYDASMGLWMTEDPGVGGHDGESQELAVDVAPLFEGLFEQLYRKVVTQPS